MNNTEVFNSLEIGDKVKLVGHKGVYKVIQSPAVEQSGKMCYVIIAGEDGQHTIRREDSHQLQVFERFPDRSNTTPMWSLKGGN